MRRIRKAEQNIKHICKTKKNKKCKAAKLQRIEKVSSTAAKVSHKYPLKISVRSRKWKQPDERRSAYVRCDEKREKPNPRGKVSVT